MTEKRAVEILIVGSGPAGMSTALHLVQARPEWAGRIIVLEKAIHPREKLCGGGLTRLGMEMLSSLGLTPEVPFLPVNEVRLVYQNQRFSVTDNPVFWVVLRNTFDHWLVQEVERRGIQVRQGEGLTAIRTTPDFVEVTTDHATYHAQAVVAADGSRSFVRQALSWPDTGRTSRLLEVLTPEVTDATLDAEHSTAVFDFTAMASGLQGYYWDFPCRIEGRPFMNRGVFDSRVRKKRPRANLKGILAEALADRRLALTDYPLKGHPIHRFDSRATLAQPRVILAGDAAGADPLFGEGISFALGYGRVAAEALYAAFDRQDFEFADYRSRVLADPLLAQLVVRASLSRWTYWVKSPRLLAWWWWLAPWLIHFLALFNPRYVPISSPRVRRLS